MSSPRTPLAEVLATARLTGVAGRATVPADWAQGRTLFGGLTAGLALEALREAAPELPPLRSALVQFVGPVAPGEVALARRRLRAGATLVQELVEVSQGDALRAMVTATYGRGRSSGLGRAGPRPPAAPAPEEVPEFQHREGLTPIFMRHLDFRFCLGGVPFTGGEVPELGGWVRLLEPGGVGPEPLAALLLGAWPPPGLVPLRAFVPASTVTWAFHLTPALAEVDPAGWFLFQAESPQAAEGFAPVEAALWDGEGRALGFSSQLDVVFG